MKISNLLIVVGLSFALAACSTELTETDLPEVSSSAESALLAKGPGTPPASGNGILNVIHGVPEATVDVCAKGPATGDAWAAVIEDFTFTESRTLEIAAGSYDVNVVAANDACTNPIPGLSATGVVLPEGANASAVAHLNESNTATLLTVFLNNVTKNNRGTLAAHHTAAAPAVDIWAGRNPQNMGLAVEDFASLDQEVLALQPGRRDVNLTLPDGSDFLLEPSVSLVLKSNRYYGVYAVGVFPASFTFVVIEIGAYE